MINVIFSHFNPTKYFFIIFFSMVFTVTKSQVVNGYAKVTSIAGNTLSVNNVNETFDTFEDNELVIIMQMQDNVIGNTTNTASFGSLGSILSAGRYEVRTILSHTESASLPTTITLSSALGNSYNTGANSSVQIITFPRFGSPNYTTTGNMAALDWNGNIGGVIAFEVLGTLTLANNITANGAGFRGGADDVNATCGGSVCEDNIYISTWTTRALKGEGIYKNTNTAYDAARGRILNGGGGGSCHNGAGGGGGNYTAGGKGGIGWGCQSSAPLEAGGLGGLSLSGSISASRIFMGGGGGAGEENNNFNTAGGDGGGIILIKANQVRTTGSCGGITVSANGLTTPDIGNDGAGGAGGGGTIVFQVNTWNIVATCPINVSASGGNGGSSLSGGIHGGGGGGGQGVIIYSITTPTSNTTNTTNNGNGGCGNTSNPCNSQASGGGGSNGSGVIGGSTGPLPIELLNFDALVVNENKKVRLVWSTASEVNNEKFIVERSSDGYSWVEVVTEKGSGTTSDVNSYEAYDYYPIFGVSYYRLKQIDYNGDYTYSPIVNVYIYSEKGISVYPVPFKDKIAVEFDYNPNMQVSLLNALGQKVNSSFSVSSEKYEFDTSDLPNGFYTVMLVDGSNVFYRKVIKK